MVLLQAKLGQVFLLDEPFPEEGESFDDHGQLPQFFPRTEWPSNTDAIKSQRYTIALDPNVKFEPEKQVEKPQPCVQTIYPKLSPLPPYNTDDGLYDNVDWDVHATFVHNIFHRSMQSNSSLSADEMTTLVRIVSYGMFKSMTHLSPWHVPFSDQRGELFHEEWSPTFRMYLKCGDYPDDVRNKVLIKHRIWTRRWLVVPIKYGPTQWGMTIFDREKGQLYIFDCGDQENRRERIEAAIEYWVQFWNDLQMPHTFQYFVPAVTRQPSTKDSGLLAIIWLMNTLRDQVGENMDSTDESIQRENIVICRPHPAPSEFQSALHLRDWMPTGCRTASTALLGVRRIIRVMLCNELGLSCHDAMTKHYNNFAGRHPPFIPSAMTQITKVARELVANTNTLEKWSFWTQHGGPQFVMPQRIAIREYDESDRSQARRFRPLEMHSRYRIETEPKALSPPPNQPLRWIADGFSFSPDNPVSRPPHGINLQVAAVGHDVRQETDCSQTYVVSLNNEAAPPKFREMLPLIIKFDRIQKRRWLDEEDEFIQFDLLVAADGAIPHAEVVNIKIPPGGAAVVDLVSPDDEAVDVSE